MRSANVKRKTAETDISLTLSLDGTGKSEIRSGVGFLDHMLTLFARHGRFDLTLTDAAKDYMIDTAFDPQYGARPLKRAVMRYVEDPVSEYIIADRALRRKEDATVRTLKLTLAHDKESTVVVPA